MHSLLQVKLQATGHNRALQRNKISCVLEDFCAVQEEADRLDTNLVVYVQQDPGAEGQQGGREDACSEQGDEGEGLADQSFKEQEEAIRKKYQDLQNSC